MITDLQQFLASWLILGLLAQLGHPSWQKRELAQVKLKHLLPLAITQDYLKQGKSSKDCEVAVRCKHVLHAYWVQTAPAKAKTTLPKGYHKLPWIDMLPEDYPNKEEVIRAWLEVARNTVGNTGPPKWADYEYATYLLLLEEYQFGISPTEAETLLDAMVANEKKWIKKYGANYDPPLTVPD